MSEQTKKPQIDIEKIGRELREKVIDEVRGTKERIAKTLKEIAEHTGTDEELAALEKDLKFWRNFGKMRYVAYGFYDW